MKGKMKKILGLAISAAMAVSAVMPWTGVTAFAEGETITDTGVVEMADLEPATDTATMETDGTTLPTEEPATEIENDTETLSWWDDFWDWIFGSKDEVDTQDVYVYVENSHSSQNAVVNDHGYYTVGKITLTLPDASEKYSKDQGKGDEVYNNYADAITEALKSISRYEANSWLDLEDVNWYSLHTDSGADDYVSTGWTWHLDGAIKEDVQKYTVTFDANGGSFQDDSTTVSVEGYLPGENINTSSVADPEKTDWNFLGWSFDPLATEPGHSFVMPESDVTLYAVWELAGEPAPDTFTVEYSWTTVPADKELPNGLELPKGGTYQTGESFDVDLTYYTGYTVDAEDGTWTFSGWSVPTSPEENSVVAIKGTWTFEADEEPKPPASIDWDVSKSKTATNLDSNFESDVTLSLPAADYEPEIDVVFVIDDTHAGSGIFVNAVEGLLDELQEKENLDVNVGIVTFDAVARDWLNVTSNGALNGLVPLDENVDAILTAVNTELSYDNDGQAKKVGATNLEWPVDMANDMLKQGTGSDKYLVMFSDMYGYVYRGDITIDGITYHDVPLSKRIGTWNQGSLSMGTKYTTFDAVYTAYMMGEGNETVDGFFRDSSWENYWQIYYDGSEKIPNMPTEGFQVDSGTFSGFEKSVGMTYNNLLEAAQNAHVILVNNDFYLGDAQYGQTIKNGMLESLKKQGITVYQYTNDSSAEETAVMQIFNNLRDELIQLVDAGSYVVDEIGSGADYDFAFVNESDKLVLKVGNNTYNAVSLGENQYGFAADESLEDGYQYVLTYYPDGTEFKGETYGECFVWKINVPVTKDAKVQLTYTVQLVNPQEEPGTYGQYDEDGSENYDGLYTNNSATLFPVDSNGDAGASEEFQKPTVSYTVADTSEPSDLGPDNPPYIPDGGDEEEPSEPTEEIPEEETPQTSLPTDDTSVPDAIPGEPSAPSTEEIPDNTTPQTAQPPQTGARAAGSVVLLAGAAVVAALTLRRKK